MDITLGKVLVAIVLIVIIIFIAFAVFTRKQNSTSVHKGSVDNNSAKNINTGSGVIMDKNGKVIGTIDERKQINMTGDANSINNVDDVDGVDKIDEVGKADKDLNSNITIDPVETTNPLVVDAMRAERMESMRFQTPAASRGPNVYPANPPLSQGYYSPFYNTVINDRPGGCFGAATQPTGSISNGTLPMFYNHSYDSVSSFSPDARNQRWYGPHSAYLN